MSKANLELYDRDRPFGDKAFRSACYAPFVSLYFDQLGFVRVCCQNFQHTLGNVARRSLDEIWNGERIGQLRSALRKYNFQVGCQYCKWQVDEGNYNNFARQFDRWPVESTSEFWPAQMEFSISNACNLECVMCNGEWSSSIRSRREKLPPLRKVYDDRFFADLRKYLPHVKWLKFLGGEPFLSPECRRIWDMILEDGLRTPCHVTTNGTQYNARVERILESLPVSFSVSIDGATKQTYERIRKNAVFEEVMENFRRFHDYARRRGTSIALTYCLMPANWREFGDFLLFADGWDVDVCVNTVLHPPEHSLYAMSAEELRPIVEGLEVQGRTIQPKLGRNRDVWTHELERIRHRMLHADRDALSFLPGKLVERIGVARPAADPQAEARRVLEAWSGGGAVDVLVCDDRDVVVAAGDGGDAFLGVPLADCLGRPFHDVYALLRMRYGAMTAVHRRTRGEFVDRYFGFTSLELTERTARLLSWRRTAPSGEFLGSATAATMLEAPFRPALVEK
jgi:MoaA/NifB/PqqE/SkfB family radical SAM enzyme